MRGGKSSRRTKRPTRCSSASIARRSWCRRKRSLRMRCHVARPAMGCLFEIYLHGDDPERLEGAAEEALAEIERLDQQLSHYRGDSDTARINGLAGSDWVRVEPDLYRLIERCLTLSK